MCSTPPSIAEDPRHESQQSAPLRCKWNDADYQSPNAVSRKSRVWRSTPPPQAKQSRGHPLHLLNACSGLSAKAQGPSSVEKDDTNVAICPEPGLSRRAPAENRLD